MESNYIRIINAKVNNLKNVSLNIPKNKFIVITGLSGSGKSSLAFDTIYAEGQRRYAESLNAYARQFMDLQDKPDVEEIQGLSPTIAIDQKNYTQNPRSTVGTATEIADYLRLLFARIGTQYDPETNKPIIKYTIGQIVEKTRKLLQSQNSADILSPIIKQGQIKPKLLMKNLEESGFDKFRLNGMEMNIHQISSFHFHSENKYDVDIIIGKITENTTNNLLPFIEKAIDISNGFVIVHDEDTGEEHSFSILPICQETGKIFEPIEPRSFSFNSPYGACSRCGGLGSILDIDPELVIPNMRLTLGEGAIQPWTRIVGNQQYYQKLLEAVAKKYNFSLDVPVQELPQKVMDILYYGTDGQLYIIDGKSVQFEGIIPNLTQRHSETNSDYIRKEIEHYMKESMCPVCRGKRLKPESLAVKIGDYSIADISEMSIEELNNLCKSLLDSNNKKTKKTDNNLSIAVPANNAKIAIPIIKEVQERLDNLIKVGLYYMSLDRGLHTLSGGESQRVRLATQLSAGLTGVIYILDEPSIGLHQKDTEKLIKTLKELRDTGNTVIVVEHDKTIIESADHIIDVGPGAGVCGGEIIAEGNTKKIKQNKKSITGLYLANKEKVCLPKKARKGNGKTISILGAKAYNLKNIDVEIPLAKLVCITGVSGSGKTTLIHKILGRALNQYFYKSKKEPGEHKKIKGLGNINKVITIDQTPIGRTPRSNPATYTGVFTAMRELYASQKEAKLRGYDAGIFSFNVKGGGRCEACAGEGYIRIPMQFLTDVFVECNECNGTRYNRNALEIHYRGKNISEILNMSIEESYLFFSDTKAIADKLQILRDVGLGYIKLGQSATTLSGGEAQRVKLATELSRKATGKTMYILDEPTAGLHFDDIKRLLNVLNKLVDKGNTVLIIEHNLDVIKSADWIIDLGPEGGKNGGEVVGCGTPNELTKNKNSWTGKYLSQ
jgi:excinuclease ABC subunit A